MASKSASRSLQSISRQVQQRCTCASSRTAPAAIRQFSASSLRSGEQQTHGQEEQPRWARTPKQMIAPFQTRVKDPAKAFVVNEDPKKVDAMYVKLLGRGGDKVLDEEIKWLAITHKSFDQGRRGFNDRLAFLGRRILNMQTSLALLHSPLSTSTQSEPSANDPREPFRHTALEGLRNLADVNVSKVLTKERLGNLAVQMGLSQVVRWKPKSPSNLKASGVDVVMATTLYAIIGAIALQKGGDAAARVARERVLKALGIS
ncbi:RNase III protein [Coleophoma crateriformis]|uniref:RNase III protein n=1 Tax=Coleophoma crateriformis TaxID=565419 RepID=A0A3D8T958_9HELO|nr:RNase III protein [Coleophoma crateriformis]